MKSGSSTPGRSALRLQLSPTSVSFDSVAPAPSPFGPTFGYSFSRLPRRSIVVKPSSNPSDSGSALLITLLITALLATIAVSFLSTSRVEQIAAKNFSRQNAASGLAELATQQAMAKIQQGFTVNGTATTIITTQPGAIWQYTFSGGCCTAVATKNPVELFSGTSNATTNGTANLNNLQIPSSTSCATTNQFTITGNRTEQILIPMENITSNGTIIGRIAYYVDDEGTKINLNSSTGNRTALNAANPRPFSLDSLSSFSWGTTFNATRFSDVINGAGSSNSSTADSKNWSYFYRPEQLFSLGIGLNASNASPSNFSTATSSANNTANMTHLLTPWGTQRVAINTLSTNTTDGTGDDSVNTIHTALLNSTLNAVFGGNFATKYTSVGVKQIAANMLQMRFPATATVNQRFSYTGPLLGADNLDSNGIPREYFAYAPYPVINEVGFTTVLGLEDGNGTSTNWQLKFNIQPTIELFNPYPYAFNPPPGSTPRIVVKIRSLSFDMNGTNYSIPSNPPPGFVSPAITLNPGSGPLDNSGNYIGINASSDIVPAIPAGEKVQIRLAYNSPGLSAVMELPKATPANITSIGNATIQLDYVKIIANSLDAVSDQTSTAIRDWVSGDEIGALRSQFFTNLSTPLALSSSATASPDTAQRSPTGTSAQRIYHMARKPSDIPLAAPLRYWSSTDSSLPGGLTENSSTWENSTATTIGTQANTTNASANNSVFAFPGNTSAATIPGDPSLANSISNAIYANATLSNGTLTNTTDMRIPELPNFSGNYRYTSPSDLGLVPTNQHWRRLRMQMQPASEGNLIPDWAMLDVISFGNSTNPNNAFNRMLPVNINGRFHLPGNATIAPRTIGVKALAQVLSLNASSSIQDSANSTSTPVTLTTNETKRFKGNTANATTIANAIGNMTWSANSTWGNATTGKRWKNNNTTIINNYILPSEIMEIDGVADAVSQGNYTNSSSHFKWNEGRASALIPAVTTRSSFFTIYAYAQALDIQQKIESEALTKTLVEVEITTTATATTPTRYKVKKLFTQPIPMGQ